MPVEFDLEEDWYVIRAADNYEHKAVAWCYRLIEINEEYEELKKIEEFKVPQDSEGKSIIPGYVFVKVSLEPSIFYQLPQVPYFGHWVGIRIKKMTKKDLAKVKPMGTNYPEPLSKEDLERMNKIAEMLANEAVNEEIIARNLIPGAFYKVKKGPAKGAICIFDRIDSNDEMKCHVRLLMFKHTIPAVIDITTVGDRHNYDFE